MMKSARFVGVGALLLAAAGCATGDAGEEEAAGGASAISQTYSVKAVAPKDHCDIASEYFDFALAKDPSKGHIETNCVDPYYQSQAFPNDWRERIYRKFAINVNGPTLILTLNLDPSVWNWDHVQFERAPSNNQRCASRVINHPIALVTDDGVSDLDVTHYCRGEVEVLELTGRTRIPNGGSGSAQR